jgi:hypothetical protein
MRHLSRSPALGAGDFFPRLTKRTGNPAIASAFLASDFTLFGTDDAPFMHDEIPRQRMETRFLVFHSEAFIGPFKKKVDDGFALFRKRPGLKHAAIQHGVEGVLGWCEFCGFILARFDPNPVFGGESDKGPGPKRMDMGLAALQRYIFGFDAVSLDKPPDAFERAGCQFWINQIWIGFLLRFRRMGVIRRSVKRVIKHTVLNHTFYPE